MASSMDGLSASSIAESLKSYTMCSRISLSAASPSALNTMKIGTSVRMYGRVARRHCPLLRFAPVLESILTDIPDTACVLFSLVLRHSAVNEYLDGWLFLKTNTWLFAIRSCAISTFSEPLMMK